MPDSVINNNIHINMFFTLIIWVLVFAALIKTYFKNKYNFWKKRNVPTPEYKWVFGNLLDSFILKRSVADIYAEIYREYEGYNYVGYYKFLQPGLIIRSPKLVNEILNKSFNNFHDNDYDVNVEVDYIFANNPFVASGDRWKELRNRITPSLGLGKVKAMMPLLNETADKLTKYLIQVTENDNYCLEAKELSLKYTCDNVASCAFGLDGKSFTDPNAAFLAKSKELFDPTTWNIFKTQFVLLVPSLSRIFNVRYFSKDFTHFLEDTVFQTINYREKNGIVRNDFLDAMKDLKQNINDESVFSLKDIVALAGSFFFDAYETSGIAISCILYEIAANPHAQQKLHNEIEGVLQKHENNLTYGAISEMNYLECIVKESLRKHVPILALLKRCTSKYKFPPMMTNGTGPEASIEPGTPIVIPVHALHHDPKYFPNPHQFNPERFSRANSNDITKGTYLPFGDGPRMCIGSRFGVLQTKICVVTIVKNFFIEVNKKTKVPLKMQPGALLLGYEDGIWLNFKQRNKNL